MNDITIRNLDHASVHRLRQLAWQDGRPLEEIVRELLLNSPELRALASSEAPQLLREQASPFPPPTD